VLKKLAILEWQTSTRGHTNVHTPAHRGKPNSTLHCPKKWIFKSP